MAPEPREMPGEVICRLGRLADVDGVIAAFRESKPHSIWARMGDGLARVYFEHYLSSPREILVVATTEDGVLIGACLGTTRPESYVGSFYRERALQLAAVLASAVWHRPAVLGALLQRLGSGIIRTPGPPRRDPALQEFVDPELPSSPENCCYMPLFFVRPAGRGRQVGSRMLDRFCEVMRSLEFDWCRAHTSLDNIASQRAQERAGFRCASRGASGLILLKKLRQPREFQRNTVELVTEVEGLSNLASDWAQLWEQTPEVSAFQSLEWVQSCAQDSAGHGHACYVTVVRSGQHVVAIFPTRLSRDGTLSFIGAEVSNYGGPVYLPGRLREAVESWRDSLADDPRVKSLDLAGIRQRSPFLSLVARTMFRKWGTPVLVETNVCPEIDLSPGWESVLLRHKSRQRANWRRKWDSLGELGHLTFVETASPEAISAAFPAMFDLYGRRWRGQRVHGAFSGPRRAFQERSANRLGPHNQVRLSLLRLGGEIVAYSYALRAGGISTSYVLAHDSTFEIFSPGLLLLMKVLEAAAERGDPGYDFSLGSAAYKSMWATGEQSVFCALSGPGSGLRMLKRRGWSMARSVPWLKALKQRGIASRSAGRDANVAGLPDRPGLSAGTRGEWTLYRLLQKSAPKAPPEVEPLDIIGMREAFSPRFLALALERHYRGDTAMRLKGESAAAGVIWKANPKRIPALTGGASSAAPGRALYYHPVGASVGSIRRLVLAALAEPGDLLLCAGECPGEDLEKVRSVPAMGL